MSDNELDEQMISDMFGKSKVGNYHDNFLQYYAMSADSELAKDEQKGILKDISSLAVQTNEELVEKINAVTDEMGIDFVRSDEELEIIVNKIKRLKKIITTDSLETRIPIIVTQILEKEYEKIYRGDQLMDKKIAMMRFYLNCNLKQNVSRVQNNQEFFNISPELLSTIEAMVKAGSLSDMLETLHDEELHEIIYSARGSLFQKERWEKWPKGKRYDEAVIYAEDLWANKGSQLTLKQMAGHIVNDKRFIAEKEKDDLKYKKLCDMLRPIAKKYGKLPKRGRPRKGN